MKRTALVAFSLALTAGMACDIDGPGRIITVEVTNPQAEVIEFSGRFGKHEQWEKVEGSTPSSFEFDLDNWPKCFCLHRLIVRKAAAGPDTLRIRVLHQGAVESDTWVLTQDTLDYPPLDWI